MPLKSYLAERVRREPSSPSVVPGSTPVLAFGDPTTAKAATVGLNPSRIEFLDSKGHLLEGTSRRLATLASLGLTQISQATDEQVQEVLDGCADYFRRNPYRRWFDQLEPVLNAADASYYAGTACHLDLIQWATDPTWKALPAVERQSMLREDSAFLLAQLEQERIETVLLNGMGVIRRFQRQFDVSLPVADVIDDGGHQPTRICSGRLSDRVRVVGWSTNMQSSFGVTSERRRLIAEHVGRLVAQ